MLFVIQCIYSFRLYHQQCDGKQEKNDYAKQINNAKGVITKNDDV